MFSSHIQSLLLFSYPEAMVVLSMTLILMGANIDWRKMLASAVFIGTTAYIVKHFFGYVYINVFLYAVYMTAALSFFKISGIYERFISSIITSGIYFSMEFMFLTIIISIIGIPVEIIINNIGIKFLCFASQLLAAIGVAYLLRRFKMSVFG